MWNLTQYPYASSRRVIMGQQCAAATSQPLATLAGMEMFWSGGNAVDAAIAMAIALTVVEPTSNGIGSDAFAIVWDGKLHGLNASGRSPKGLTLDCFADMSRVPEYGWLSVTVPGAVSAWHALWSRWGKLTFEQLFEPAIRYAETGFPVSPETALAWQRAESTYLPLTQPECQPFKPVFFPYGKAPSVGEIWRSTTHAATLRAIAASEGESFYRGTIAVQIAEFAAATGGLITLADLAEHGAEWVEPISVNYRGLRVWELPPNTQGIATLVALNILEGFDLSERSPAESAHLQIESMKLAFADIHRYVADPKHLNLPVEQLLSKTYAAQRRQAIGEKAIALAEPGLPKEGTVYLATADADLMVSFIQSNYMQFGSGVLIPDTGIALQNRGMGFTLAPNRPNCVAPAKRPFHTIMPGFLTQGAQPLGPFGVMGGSMQPQGHLQVVVNLADHKLNPQATLDAPRWQFLDGDRVLLEQTMSPDLVTALHDRGHDVRVSTEIHRFGKGQIILRQSGIFISASDPRSDGLAMAR